MFLGVVLLSIYTYIKSRLFGNKTHVSPLFDRDCQIAIIGGGVGAAYALLESGYRNVTIFEAREKLGRHAKTHIWQGDMTNITTGLSVLAWPLIFRNYIHLLNRLHIDTTTVRLPFFIHHKDENWIFAHGKEDSHTQQYNNELKRWNRMVNTVRYVSEVLSGQEVSLYHFSLLNPFNYISLRFLTMLFGISPRFWNNLVVPIYASSFLSTKSSFILSSILPTIDSLISLQPNAIPTLQTWLQTSLDVFDRMSKSAIVKTKRSVYTVHIERMGNNRIRISIETRIFYRWNTLMNYVKSMQIILI